VPSPAQGTTGRTAPVLFFFGHHRCATSWMNDIFSAVARELHLRHLTLHHARMFGYDLRRFTDAGATDCIAYVNADYEHIRRLEHIRGFHVVRDPRDVTVSAYFSHLHSHSVEEWPELREHRQRLRALSREEGIIAEMENLRWEFSCMRSWRYDHPDILELRMEDLTADPYQGMIRIYRFLGLLDEDRFTLRKRVLYPVFKGLRLLENRLGTRVALPVGPDRLPVERLLGIVWENDFATKANGRTPGREDPRSHYRKGAAGDWRNHFTERHISYFKEHFGDLLVTLGYESDRQWT
jgi:hypothetical protein